MHLHPVILSSSSLVKLTLLAFGLVTGHGSPDLLCYSPLLLYRSIWSTVGGFLAVMPRKAFVGLEQACRNSRICLNCKTDTFYLFLLIRSSLYTDFCPFFTTFRLDSNQGSVSKAWFLKIIFNSRIVPYNSWSILVLSCVPHHTELRVAPRFPGVIQNA